MKLNWNSWLIVVVCAVFSLSAAEPFGNKQIVYNTFGIRKSIFVPKFPAKAWIDDFDIFYNGKKAVPGKLPARTRVELSRSTENLFLHIRADEPVKVRDNNKKDSLNLWRGDLFEIFFGGVEPAPWCMQFVVGAGGGRFSDTLPLNRWQSRAIVKKNGYELYVTIPLAALKNYQSGIGFNICRQRYRELSVWSMVSYGFHEPENFGELLLDDYAEVFEKRFGLSGEKIKTREAFENASWKNSVPATVLKSGPRLLYPEKNRISVAWESCGLTFGAAEFRKAGTQKFQQVASNVTNGVPAPSRNHRVVFSGLEPDTVYEYRVINLHSVTTAEIKNVSKIYQFRTFPVQQKDFSCVLFCDAHGSFEKIAELLKHPRIAKADFIVNMGDMHSGFTGMDAIQKGFLEVQTKFLAGKKPIAFVRGNHEIRGIANGLYDTFLGHPSGKSCYLMRHGDVAFMIVDTGDPQFDIFETGKKFRLEQEKWIRESLKDPLFADAAFKVLLCHIPPTDNKIIDAMFKSGLGKTFPDLLLSGHLHRPTFFKAGEKTPFPLCIGYGALVLNSNAQEIELISINWQGKIAGQWKFPKRRKGK